MVGAAAPCGSPSFSGGGSKENVTWQTQNWNRLHALRRSSTRKVGTFYSANSRAWQRWLETLSNATLPTLCASGARSFDLESGQRGWIKFVKGLAPDMVLVPFGADLIRVKRLLPTTRKAGDLIVKFYRRRAAHVSLYGARGMGRDRLLCIRRSRSSARIIPARCPYSSAPT